MEIWIGGIPSARRIDMRVIAGTARSLPLKTVPGNKTRPTTDRIKETLFNMIAPYIPDCRFLDLFAGSGGIGIEALSRGASFAVFVEQDRAALQIIRQNLHFTHLEERAKVMQAEVVRCVSAMKAEHAFDVIFMDPPYNHDLEHKVLEALAESDLVDAHTLIIIEASEHTDFSYLENLGFEIQKDKRYGSNRHVFVSKIRKV